MGNFVEALLTPEIQLYADVVRLAELFHADAGRWPTAGQVRTAIAADTIYLDPELDAWIIRATIEYHDRYGVWPAPEQVLQELLKPR